MFRQTAVSVGYGMFELLLHNTDLQLDPTLQTEKELE